MAKKAVVQIDVETDASDAVSGFDDAARAADKLGAAVDDASRKVDTGADRLGSAADAADNLDDKTGRATGALGALSSGFELVGAEKYAGALQGAALATDFMSGVGQSLTLVLELQSVQTAITTAKTIALGIAEKTTAAATKAMAIAQKVLNAAMRANPIGLLITAGLLLATLFVTLWKRSTTFRTIVLGVWAAVRKAFEVAVGAIRTAAEKVWGFLKTLLAWSPIGILTRNWNKVEDVITAPFEAAWKVIKGIFDPAAISGLLGSALDGLIGMVNAVIKALNSAISSFNKLPGPDIPTIPLVPSAAASSRSASVPVARFASPAATTTSGRTTAAAGGYGSVVINIHGAVDPEGTARQVLQLLDRHAVRTGRPRPALGTV